MDTIFKAVVFTSQTYLEAKLSISNKQLEELLQLMKNIPYLVKFQGENPQYAKNLIDMGELHMCSAQYYIDEELVSGVRGQGDKYENEVMGFIHIDMGCPIYCMYAVYECQCDDEFIWVDKKIIEDFCPSGGYITVCETLPFIRQFNRIYTKGYDAGLVTYGNRNVSFDMQLLGKRQTGHFFKRPDLKYQQEFRIVLDEKLNEKELPEDRQVLVAKDGRRFWRPYEYGFKNFNIGDITKFSKQVKTTDLEEYDTGYKIKM